MKQIYIWCNFILNQYKVKTYKIRALIITEAHTNQYL